MLYIGIVIDLAHNSRNRVWEKIQPKGVTEIKVALMKRFDIMEIHIALRASSLMTCSREDGINPQFFLEYWEYIGEDLTKAYQINFYT